MKLTGTILTSDPPSAPSGAFTFYFKSDGLYFIDDAGTATKLSTGGGSSLPDGDYGDVTVSGSGTVITIDNGVVSLAKIESGVVSTDGTLSDNSDAKIATQKATKTYVDTAVTGLLDFKGSTNCASSPNYPAASKGDAYIVSGAGKIGGASGKSVDIGDVYLAIADNAGGTEASVGASWSVLEHNLVGALLAANNLSDVASASTARTNLGLAIGTNVQAWDADLDTWAGKTAPTGVVIGTTDTQTLTNKRITQRTGTATSSATPTINTDNVDYYSLTALALDITSMTTNLSGTPTDAQKLWISITGTAARAITWGTGFEAGAVALPTTTVTTQRLDVGFIWNAVTSKWRCMASGSA